MAACKKKYDDFLSGGRKQAHLTDKQMCAGDDQVFIRYPLHYIALIGGP